MARYSNTIPKLDNNNLLPLKFIAPYLKDLQDQIKTTAIKFVRQTFIGHSPGLFMFDLNWPPVNILFGLVSSTTTTQWSFMTPQDSFTWDNRSIYFNEPINEGTQIEILYVTLISENPNQEEVNK